MPWRQSPTFWLVLLGTLAGGLGGTGWGLWARSQWPHWQAQREALQSQARQQVQAQARAAQSAQRARLQEAAHRREQAWHDEREQVLRWHALLGQAAAETGMRVQLWQGQGQFVQLQLSLPPASDALAVQTQLNRAGAPDWRLHSLSEHPGQGLQVVLQAPLQARSAESGRGLP